MHISLIAAMDRNRVIGRDAGMPWHLPADLAHFKKTTLGKPIIMGRKTFESIGRALPGRQNIVISRQAGLEMPGCERVVSLESALSSAKGREAMIIGGGEIYALAMPVASQLYITEVDTLIEDGEVWFPVIDPDSWLETDRVHRPADGDNPFDLDFVEYHRK
jgi:dihydrofolate reductase